MVEPEESIKVNDEILKFMGKVDQHMNYSNEIQRDYIIDRKDLYEKVGKLDVRLAKTETRQGIIMKTGTVVIAATIAFFTRGYWMKH